MQAYKKMPPPRGMRAIDDEMRSDVPEIIDDRAATIATIISSQRPI